MSTPPRSPWKPKRRKRKAKLTASIAVLVTPRMGRSVRQAAALFGMTVSSFIRAALIKECERAHAVMPPQVDAPEEEQPDETDQRTAQRG